MRSFPRLVLLSCIAAGCGDFGLVEWEADSGGAARITFSPSGELRFDTVSPYGEPAEETLTARSAGTEPVTVTDLTLDGDDVASFDIGRVALPARLQPDETLDIPLSFSPNAVGGFSAILVIETNIDESPTSERRLSGQSCNDTDRDGRCDPNGPEAVDSGAPGG